MGVLVCVLWGSMVAQQAEMPAAPKPGLLSRLWDRVHLASSPAFYVRQTWHGDHLVLPPEVKTPDEPAPSLTEQLESVRKQKAEIEQQEAKLIDALKKQYEADKVRLEESRQRLEEERQRLEDLGVLPEPAASPTTSVFPEPASQYGEGDNAGCGFIIEAEANFAIMVGTTDFDEEIGLILVARKRPGPSADFTSFVFRGPDADDQDACKGLEEERRRLEKLGVLPGKLFDGFGGVGLSF
jgi:hypothetical protein